MIASPPGPAGAGAREPAGFACGAVCAGRGRVPPGPAAAGAARAGTVAAAGAVPCRWLEPGRSDPRQSPAVRAGGPMPSTGDRGRRAEWHLGKPRPGRAAPPGLDRGRGRVPGGVAPRSGPGHWLAEARRPVRGDRTPGRGAGVPSPGLASGAWQPAQPVRCAVVAQVPGRLGPGQWPAAGGAGCGLARGGAQ